MLISTSALLAGTEPETRGGSRWGANYFPNVTLTTHEGEQVRFFDDLIEGKVVMINFIYTTCPDACPLETAKLCEVQEILGDRMGDDVFFYSITIDPEVDTPEVLAEYSKQYQTGPGWLFLTGNSDDITLLRRKLGLYIEEIQDGSNDHNLSMMIGNQSTGRWMKRSPFENPYLLAKEIGGALHNFKVREKGDDSYANAPKLRKLSKGESLYRTRCAVCHAIGQGDGKPKVGPNLLGIFDRRDNDWIERWIREPDVMLAEKDSIAIGLFEAYNRVPMPNMNLNDFEIAAVMEFMQVENRRVARVEGVAALASRIGAEVPSCCEKNEAPVLSGDELADARTMTPTEEVEDCCAEAEEATMSCCEEGALEEEEPGRGGFPPISLALAGLFGVLGFIVRRGS